ncbi:DEAD/DEAH box helicase [Haloechinothrix sp. LS1_15]|uniref:DEAD/DEAH box helicase n=1 Tax=Haloechinothrix sp. LS1_15 TaxID=2652248 RepID=UPI00294856AD|nr:DEAD/DEAH box helicase [Haloechinothrix sp. LS1_15]MDV6011365.1 DEAD/DEAH box helicase [Haloechinothrix sp. LS1_15]
MPGQAGQLLERILSGLAPQECPVTHHTVLPARDGSTADWPAWAPDDVVTALAGTGIRFPWSHQRLAADTAWSGQHVVLSTGTASGKSFGYRLPVLSALYTANAHETGNGGARQRSAATATGAHSATGATALYLAPTKALAADQVRGVTELQLPGIRAATYDGDTPTAERDWVRTHANWVFTNPDMLHFGILARHSRWQRLLRDLRYIVIDECHSYRGVFGSHVALLLRRLYRIAEHYGARPVLVLASATMAEPAEFATRLTGLDCTAVTEDASPHGARTVALWEPPLRPEVTGENGAPVRRSAGAEAARVLADLVTEGARTLAFVRSRRGAELTALTAARYLSEVDQDLAAQVAVYRAGLLSEERRALERDLLDGRLRGVATTNALELGVDIAGLDAVVLAGYPGTLASFWQQAGRAGRAGAESLVVFIARDDPLDTYLVHNPSAILDQPFEATVLDPGNPNVLAPHLVCAAAELPLRAGELDRFGRGARTLLDSLASCGTLRRRASGWYWTSLRHPHEEVAIRGTGGEQITVVEGETARILGTVDPATACATVHPGAVYLHQGTSYVVDELDLDHHVAFVHHEDPEWNTTARQTTDIAVLEVERQLDAGGIRMALGTVTVTEQVVGYLRKLPSGEVIDQVPLDLPPQRLTTRAVWYSISEELLNGRAPGGARLDPERLPGALHAAEHAAIGLLPLFATCDRWDVGGVSTALHEDTGEATVFVHDGHPGGAGFADRGYATLIPWLAATREAIVSCECSAGCPSCVQSPKCGNGNEPLDKAGAVTVLDIVLGATREEGIGGT